MISKHSTISNILKSLVWKAPSEWHWNVQKRCNGRAWYLYISQVNNSEKNNHYLTFPRRARQQNDSQLWLGIYNINFGSIHFKIPVVSKSHYLQAREVCHIIQSYFCCMSRTLSTLLFFPWALFSFICIFYKIVSKGWHNTHHRKAGSSRRQWGKKRNLTNDVSTTPEAAVCHLSANSFLQS